MNIILPFLSDILSDNPPTSGSYVALIFIAVIAFFVLAIVGSYFSVQARNKAWGELADRTGLMLQGGGFLSSPRLEGVYRGHSTTLYTHTVHTGKHSHTYTRVRMDVNNQAGLSLSLQRENVLSKIGKAVGMQDIQLGDEEMDQRFLIQGKPADEVSGLFTSISLRQRLLENNIHSLRLNGRTLEHSQSGVETRPDVLQGLFDTMADLADAVERAGGSSSLSGSWMN
jgi:hypothetical protein